MADFPKKYLHYVAKSIKGDASEEVAKFGAALSKRADSVSNKAVFLPNMAAITSSDKCSVKVNSSSKTTGLSVYKVNRPGFLYYQHWKGSWNPSGWFQVLVCKDNKFTSGVYELYNTQDTSSGGGSGGNDHSNMLPFNPGSSTYILVRGNIDSNIKKLFYVPAWTGDSSNLGTNDTLTIQTDTVNLPGIVVSGNANDDGFRQCFE